MQGSPVRVRASALSISRHFLPPRAARVARSSAEGSTRGPPAVSGARSIVWARLCDTAYADPRDAGAVDAHLRAVAVDGLAGDVAQALAAEVGDEQRRVGGERARSKVRLRLVLPRPLS